MDVNKLFDNYLDVTTSDNKVVHIKKKKIYINDSSNYYGKKYIVTSKDFNKENLDILNEIYSLEGNRLRYQFTRYTDINLVNTIEINSNGNEVPIMVLESYKKKDDYISSIGNIKRIDSDKIDEINKNKKKKDIFKLILKPTSNRDNKKEAA